MPHAGFAAVILGVTLVAVLHFVYRASKQQNAHQYYGDPYSNYPKRDCIMDNENCPICLCPLDDRRCGRRHMLRDCKHQFHMRCINEWRVHVQTPSCPICRSPFS